MRLKHQILSNPEFLELSFWPKERRSQILDSSQPSRVLIGGMPTPQLVQAKKRQ